MPVLDHEVHPSTVGGDRYEECQRKVRKPGYWAPDREYLEDGTYIEKQTFIEDKSSKPCRYDMSDTQDSKCIGCPQRGVGRQYDNEVRSRGA